MAWVQMPGAWGRAAGSGRRRFGPVLAPQRTKPVFRPSWAPSFSERAPCFCFFSSLPVTFTTPVEIWRNETREIHPKGNLALEYSKKKVGVDKWNHSNSPLFDTQEWQLCWNPPVNFNLRWKSSDLFCSKLATSFPSRWFWCGSL